MKGPELKAQLRREILKDLEDLLDQVSQHVSQAPAGRVIADSEEGVRDAVAEFRRQVYQKALKLRMQAEGPAFSPCEERGPGGVAE